MLIRFKKNDGTEYPQWEEKRLGEILVERNIKNCKDGTYEHVSLTKEGVVPKSDRYNRDFLVRDENKEYKITKKNDICYNPANLKFGVICRNKFGNGIFSPIYITFEILKTALPEFIEYLVTRNDFINYALKYQQGTVYERMAVSPSDLLSIKINLPCLEEQQKIADFLSTVDQRIEAQKAIVADYEELKKGTMQKIFNQEIRFKDDDGNEFPEWEEKKLQQIVGIFDGTHQTPKYVNEGIPFVSVENISDLYATKKYITKEAFENEFKIYPQKNDVLMTRIGDIGTANIVTEDSEMAYYVSLALFKPYIEILSNYLVQYINCDNFQNELWKRTLHVAFPKKINKGEIGQCIVKLPCLEEQEKIADCLSALDRKIEAEKKILADLEELKKGFLQALFNN